MTTDLNTLREALDEYGYARRLAEAIFQKHYARDSHYASGEVVWQPFDDLIGVLTQIDNMVSGLSRLEAAAAAEYERGRQDGMKQEHALWKLAQAGQAIEAAAVLEPLADNKIAEIASGQGKGGALPFASTKKNWAAIFEFARAIEQAHGIGVATLPGVYPDLRAAANAAHEWATAALARSAPVGEVKPVAKLWLWKNFVDGKPEYWAFDNAFPVYPDSDDPQTLGEPCGYALFKPSRAGRPDVSDEEVLRRIAATPPAPPEGWKLVPVEPTPEMVNAGLDAASSADAPEDELMWMYQAMLSAAPQPGAVKDSLTPGQPGDNA